MKPLTETQIRDLEEQAYKVTPEDVKHGKKFPRLMTWAFGIIICLLFWGWIIVKYIIRP